jgi:ribose 5-phosphate isomerase A
MSADDWKRMAAERALSFVQPRMRLGLGTGSTATKFVECLAREVKKGLEVICVPTSEASHSQPSTKCRFSISPSMAPMSSTAPCA